MRAVDVLAMPFHAARIASSQKSFLHNPLLRSPRLNRYGLHAARVRAAMRMAERRRQSLARHVPEDVREQYQENGYVALPDFLSDDVFQRVRAEIAGDFERHDMVQGSTATRRAMIDPADLRERPGLRAARSDPRMLDTIRYVASSGGQPLIVLQIVMAGPSGGAGIDPQTNLHADTFHPCAKSWLFLEDVGPEDGPFAYVPGSHRMTPERMEWETGLVLGLGDTKDRHTLVGSPRVPADQLGALGYKQPVPMVVRANTLVVADTHGFHARSASPNPTTRIEIYGSLRRNPFVPWTGGHAASLPGIAGRTNRLSTEGLTALKRLGLRGSPWRAKGVGPIREWPAELSLDAAAERPNSPLNGF